MSDKKQTDVLVIGAGPGGYPAAFHAADLGMTVTLVDPEANPGGVCLYRGCVPSKALLHVASFLHQVEQAPEWGLSLGQPDLDLDKLRSWKNKVVKNLTGGLGHLVRQRKIEYVQGTARLKDAHRATVTPQQGDAYDLKFDHAVVATGSVPASLPGLPDSDRVMDSRQALDLPEVPNTLLVVGGGYIGIELGQVYAALGSRVTLVEMLPGILPGADRDLVRLLSRRLDKQFDSVLTGTRVNEVKEHDGRLRVSFEGDRDSEGAFDKIMIAVGRRPLTRELGLSDAGIEVADNGWIEVDEQRRTSRDSVYAVGDVAGEPMLAHKATHEARVAIEAIAGKHSAFDPRAIPFVVFSDPEIAWCGLSQADAKERGASVQIATFPWAASGRAATLSRKDGLTKLVMDPESGRVLGAGIAGHGAGELLAEAVLAMEMGAVAEDLALTIHTHPTLSETVMEAAQGFKGVSTHFVKG